MAARKKAAEVTGEQVHHLFTRTEPPGIEHVPTVPELEKQGLARVVSSGKAGTYYRMSEEGQRLVFEAMKRNAERRKQHGQSH